MKRLFKIKTPRGMYNGRGARIAARYATEDGSVYLAHLVSPYGWEVGWDVTADGKTRLHTSTSLKKICETYGLELE